MTLHVLDIESRDVTAEALGLVVNAETPLPLAELTITHGDDRVTLAVLGASHAVTASAAGRQLTEQVSCDAIRAGGRPLPASDSASGYRFDSTTDTVDRTHLEQTADWLRRQATEVDGWICGAFPGDHTALTALTAAKDSDGWAWQTWHLYPGDKGGVIVKTRSRWQP
ncbi:MULTISPECIES: DUF2617 family protein [Rhodococcus]|uniref:DUF2617 domain-containing protein n=1 Tax=Rhodococcus opacus RKJ300 = JCM 13270 TaxID=1165867 RepID=I0WWT2_RHOOP|nr:MULTISPECIES: DUF2617 family protein [Rhodococcus]EID80848.1 hypothetical protein W59_06568 [Rhodococcus opacus RKJ300 = JCM 13270]QQZ15179.1 DUF2617 family protein [Rhodococcus sp. 21391]